mgnify:CR=1 FL=1
MNRIASANGLEEIVASYTAMMPRTLPFTICASKQLIAQVLKDPEDPDLSGLAEAIDACFASADCAEGRRAFMGKRTPQFSGS